MALKLMVILRGDKTTPQICITSNFKKIMAILTRWFQQFIEERKMRFDFVIS